MRFIIVDDEPLAQRVIEKYSADVPTIELAGSCDSAFEAMELLYRNEVDLIFLDINMPKISGLDFLKMLKNPPLVIITTAYRDYALESFDLDVVDYLKKPFSFERFYKSIQKAQELYSSRHGQRLNTHVSKESREENRFIFVKADNKMVKVDLNQILYIEAFGDYIKIHTTQGVIVTYHSMKGIEEMLPSNKFLRVHKSYIVAFNKIDIIEGNTIKIKIAEIPIGKSYRKNFFEMVNSKNH
ncbi:MAG: DNA-binding response regulator [Bacteroidales bacterium]|nr:MAG: DNA-binding response regulator [Bacteroidales bacterium]